MNNLNQQNFENNEIKELFRHAQKITLTPSERNRLRRTLEIHIEKHPVRNTAGERLIGYRSLLLNFIQLPNYRMAIILMIALLLGGGTSYAAESALPGDALYGVKVNLNENVRSALAVSPKAEATLQTELATRRLEEAEELAEKGKLTSALRSDIVKRFQKSSERAKTELTKMNTSSEKTAVAELNVQTESSFNTHGYILKAIGLKQKGEIETEIETILPVVQEKVESLAKERDDDEEKVKTGSSTDVEASARGKMGAAENKINTVKKAITKAKERNDEWATVEAIARLDVAEKTFAEGKIALEKKEYNNAFLLFVKSMSIAQEAMTLAQVSNFTTVQIGVVTSGTATSTNLKNKSDDEEKSKEGFEDGELPRPGETGQGTSVKINKEVQVGGTITVPAPWKYELPKSWENTESNETETEDDDATTSNTIPKSSSDESETPSSTGGGVMPQPGSTSTAIKACPEQWIVNQMPKIEDSKETEENEIKDSDTTEIENQYFIYKGIRRELSDFDVYWIKLNCKIQPQVVY